MFNWFLKLLGINEDRPNTSANSYLDSSTSNKTNSITNEAAAKAEEVSKPVEKARSADTPKSELKSKPAAESKPQAPRQEKPQEKQKSPEKAKPAAPKPAAKSLADEFLDLNANYVKILQEGGFTTKAAIEKASDKELLELKGIGKATLKILRV